MELRKELKWRDKWFFGYREEIRKTSGSSSWWTEKKIFNCMQIFYFFKHKNISFLDTPEEDSINWWAEQFQSEICFSTLKVRTWVENLVWWTSLTLSFAVIPVIVKKQDGFWQVDNVSCKDQYSYSACLKLIPSDAVFFFLLYLSVFVYPSVFLSFIRRCIISAKVQSARISVGDMRWYRIHFSKWCMFCLSGRGLPLHCVW